MEKRLKYLENLDSVFSMILPNELDKSKTAPLDCKIESYKSKFDADRILEHLEGIETAYMKGAMDVLDGFQLGLAERNKVFEDSVVREPEDTSMTTPIFVCCGCGILHVCPTKHKPGLLKRFEGREFSVERWGGGIYAPFEGF
jgi:hypothetical protein